jgi:flagellar hook assembly protein FlgD
MTCFDSYPNPFNAETNISFRLPERTKVSLVVYNVLGEKVRTLVAEEMDPGIHAVIWDGKDETGGLVASGIYFYRFETSTYAATKKLVMLR